MIWALHGNLGHPSDWQGIREAMPEATFVTPNLWEGAIVPFGEWAKRLNEEVRGDPCPVILGYSLGARLAMHAILEPVNPWKAAIFLSAHPGLEQTGERSFRTTADRQWAELLREGHCENFLEGWNAQGPLEGEPISGEQSAVLTSYPEAIAKGFDVWSLGNQEDLRAALASSPVPQLWVAGAEDRKFSAIMRQAAAGNPSATYAEIEGSGHRVPLRNPAGLAECVRRFLQELNLDLQHVDQRSDLH